MTRDNLLFAIIGLLLGFIVGFMMASTMSQRSSTPASATAPSGKLPADHPPVPGDDSQNPQEAFAQVQTAIKKARDEPKNAEAQVTAAKLEYQIQRYDQAVEFLLKANQIQPDNYEVVVMLGEANMDAGHLDVAEKWYKAAATKKPDDVTVLSSLAFIALQRGNAADAEKAIAKLEKVAPSSEDLPQFRDKLAALKSGK
jgi:cytochrome c-type biogenesis protein CcmH/NrfG